MMPSRVYTCAEFVAQLPALLQRYPKAVQLRLELPPLTPTDTVTQQVAAATSSCAFTSSFPSQLSCADSAADFVTFNATLLNSGIDADSERGSESAGAGAALFSPSSSCAEAARVSSEEASFVEAVSTVVAQTSSLTLPWCAQVQHVLSVMSLLNTATSIHSEKLPCTVTQFSCSCPVNEFTESEGKEGAGGSVFAGVSTFVVRLAPFVPPLQWNRDVDGVLGSHQSVCLSGTCHLHDGITSTTKFSENSVCGAARGQGSCGGAGDTAAAAAGTATSLTEKVVPARRYADVPPSQRSRYEDVTNTSSSTILCCGRNATELPTSLVPPSLPPPPPPLPFRVAAVLNGSVPLPRDSSVTNGVCVLCLVAVDGRPLMGGNAAPTTAQTFYSSTSNTSSTASERAFDFLCDFLAEDVIPRVSLDVVNGAWMVRSDGDRDGLWCDVCGVRERLGNSFLITFPHQYQGIARCQLRRLLFALDVSSSLLAAVMTRPNTKADAGTERAKRAARSHAGHQVAAALQEALGRLVSANVDVCSFVQRDRRTCGADINIGQPTAATAATVVPNAGAAAMLTREMLRRSIAESVSRLVSLSKRPEFKAEVVRLLWGSAAENSSALTLATVGGGDTGTGGRVSGTSVSATAIQRKIEERLLAAFPD